MISRLPGIVPYFHGHIESRLLRLGGFEACPCALKFGGGRFQMSSSLGGGLRAKFSLRDTTRSCDASKPVRDSNPNGISPEIQNERNEVK